MRAMAAWALKKCIYSLLLNEAGNAKLGESDLHLISQNTLSVSNGFVYIKMFTMERTNYLLSFSLYRTESYDFF